MNTRFLKKDGQELRNKKKIILEETLYHDIGEWMHMTWHEIQ